MATSYQRSRTRFGLFAERFLFVAGLLLLCIYAAALGYARLSQAYYGWAFERVLHGKTATLAGYLSDTVFRGPPGPERTATREEAPKAERDAPPVSLKPGALIGRLEIPGIDLSVMVLEGTGRKELAEGVGHIEGTPLPGQSGNLGIAGHRDSYFRGLKDVSARDVITLTTFAGSFRYKVEDTRIVPPSDVSVLDPTGEPTLTLITCYPFYYIGNAPKRFVVRARLLDPAAGQ
jgi:LPXTG-site transpeptidase (sortase) family protein